LAEHFALYYINADPSRAPAGIVVGPPRRMRRPADRHELSAKTRERSDAQGRSEGRRGSDAAFGHWGDAAKRPYAPLGVASPIAPEPAEAIAKPSEQVAEEHEQPAGQDDRRRQGQDPRQEHVAHGRPLQP
jgi:hypothetical protein